MFLISIFSLDFQLMEKIVTQEAGHLKSICSQKSILFVQILPLC